MTDIQFNTILKDALTVENREVFVSDWALSSVWEDKPEDDIPQQRIDEIGQIWDAAHMSFADILKASGRTLVGFAEHYSIPYRTVQNWKSGIHECPVYLRLLLARVELGLFDGRKR